MLKSIQKNTNAIVIKTIGIDQPNSSTDTLQILNNVRKTKLLIANFQSVVNTKSNVTFDEPDYQYSQTFYFNNSYPTQNVAVTISYNMTYSGIITAASVSTSTWGNSFGSTWTQTSATVGFYGGLIWFSVNGTYTAALGIGSWSLTSANAVQFTGDMYYLPERGKASLAGACSQRPIF